MAGAIHTTSPAGDPMNKIVDFPGRERAPVVQLVRPKGPNHYEAFCHFRSEMLDAWRKWVDTRREDLDPMHVLDELNTTTGAMKQIVDLANTWQPPKGAA